MTTILLVVLYILIGLIVVFIGTRKGMFSKGMDNEGLAAITLFVWPVFVILFFAVGFILWLDKLLTDTCGNG